VYGYRYHASGTLSLRATLLLRFPIADAATLGFFFFPPGTNFSMNHLLDTPLARLAAKSPRDRRRPSYMMYAILARFLFWFTINCMMTCILCFGFLFFRCRPRRGFRSLLPVTRFSRQSPPIWQMSGPLDNRLSREVVHRDCRPLKCTSARWAFCSPRAVPAVPSADTGYSYGRP